VGDKVRTSGLDNIFFTNTPVGVVTKIEIKSSYKIAHIRTYADIYHPKTFFLVNDANRTLTENFDSNATYLTPFKIIETQNNINPIEQNISISNEQNMTLPLISSIPSRIDQTQEETIDPVVPVEKNIVTKPKKKRKSRKKKKSNKKKKQKPKTSTLDFF
jgi:rod shape-determining protein MreC